MDVRALDDLHVPDEPRVKMPPLEALHELWRIQASWNAEASVNIHPTTEGDHR